MSAEVAHQLSDVVAANVRRWRERRGLDQQGLASRLADLGWRADRTAIVKIEQRKRKVSVDDLGLLAAALNVPLTVLLVPLEGGDVTVSPEGRTKAVNRWWWFEWMIGNEPLPGRGPKRLMSGNGRPAPDDFAGEWRTGAEPLWLYERVRRAQQATARSYPLGDEPAEWLDGLQELVDAVEDMESSGFPAADLIGAERRRAVKRHDITRTEKRRFNVGQEGSG